MLTIVKKNDSYDAITYQLENEDNSTVDLTGASVNFVMGKKNKLITNAKATVTSATSGIVSYQLTPLDTLVSGTFLAEFVVTFANGTVKTYPSNGYITVDVEQNLDTSQANVVVDMIAEKQGDFTSKLNSILQQAGNINMSAMNEYSWTATEGQLIFIFPSSVNYTPSTKWFQVSVGNVPVDNTLVNRSYDNQFALNIDSSNIRAGMTVRAMWVEPITPVVPNSYKIIPQQNLPPVDAGEGDLWFDTSDNTYQGTVFDDLNTKVINNTTSLADSTSQIRDNTKLIYTTSRGNWQPRPIITFIDDDGFDNLLNVLKPIFLEKNVPLVAAVYSTSQVLNTTDKINQLLDLQNNHGWEIASHTMYHDHLSTMTEQQIRDDSKNILNYLRNLKFNVESIVYPFGDTIIDSRRVISEYYRCGVGVEMALPTLKYNLFSKPNLYNLLRANFGFDSTKDFAYYKQIVDDAITNNAWLIWEMHINLPSFDANQRVILGQIIDYIKSLNVQIVNLKDGLNYYEPLVTVDDYSKGLNDDYFTLHKTGKVISNSAIRYEKLNAHPSTDLISSYLNPLTIFSVNSSGNTGYPSSGTVVTIKGNDNGWHQQLWFDYYSNSMQLRRIDSTGAWTAWTPMIQSNIHTVSATMNAFTATSPLTSFTQNTITSYMFDGTQSGYPSGAGIITTYRMNANAWNRQECREYQGNNIWVRYWNTGSSTWTSWEKLITQTSLDSTPSHVVKPTLNAYTNANLLTDFPVNQITTSRVDTANANGLPSNTAGVLTTYSLGNGYGRQEYRKYLANELWGRYVDGAGAWTAWVKLSV